MEQIRHAQQLAIVLLLLLGLAAQSSSCMDGVMDQVDEKTDKIKKSVDEKFASAQSKIDSALVEFDLSIHVELNQALQGIMDELNSIMRELLESLFEELDSMSEGLREALLREILEALDGLAYVTEDGQLCLRQICLDDDEDTCTDLFCVDIGSTSDSGSSEETQEPDAEASG